ncbi:MAG TPA: hypothetical protein VGS07_12055 [Thermoanaerobaculia bacterium]|jgi:hypothetical protein|nr:hypothetical protein [Thermoanaerobaculia bacterium]
MPVRPVSMGFGSRISRRTGRTGGWPSFAREGGARRSAWHPASAELKSRRRTPWKEEGIIVGWARAAQSLTQVLVANAGHLVPMDQPKVALEMLDRFLAGRSFVEL